MDIINITKADARKIILHAAGLSKPAQFGKGKDAVFKVIDHLGFLQLDTNYVVERAHHHMLASRIPNYKPEWLEELQSERRIFEYFTADAGFMPMTDFKYSLPLKEKFKMKRKTMSQGEINVMSRVLDRIAREGPLMARDFENDRVEKSKGWWDWRPSKMALERLYLEGSLMTLRTKNFQKIYDLPINVVPSDIDITMPGAQEFARYMIFRSLQRLGIAYANEVAWSAHFIKGNSVKEEIKKMAGDGEISVVTIDGMKGPLYMLPEYKKKRIAISDNVFIISPFDPLNVFRRRLKSFFDFDYQIECFVPKEKRKYGYFSLPIIKGDRFLARMDSKADRISGTLIIHNIHFEPVKIIKSEIMYVSDAIRAFAKFNQCERIVVSKSNNKELLKALRN
jgi:uncharacterized protein YcaQ